MNKIQSVIIWLCVAVTIWVCGGISLAQGNQAIVIMRAGNTETTNCDGVGEMNYQSIYDLRLNNESSIRLIIPNENLSRSPDSLAVSRKLYEDAAKNKLPGLFQIKWKGSLLTATTGSGQTEFLVLPEEMKPDKNAPSRLSSFYSVMLSGEARNGKQKRKTSFALRDVWKIYFISDGGNVNDVLFNHAMEEKSITVWEAFLRKTNNYRISEANTNMRDVLIGCTQTALRQFADGNYKALEMAKQRIERAQSVKSDETTQKLTADINQQKQRVTATREQVFRLIGESRWDEAITAAEPIKIYLSTWEDLNAMYNGALKQSHEQHLAKGKQSLESSQLDLALTECTVAWKRLPDSAPARGCVCTARNRVALRDSGNYRQRKQPKLAKELLEKQLADGDCDREEAVAKELGIAKCEYAAQLLTEARQLMSGNAVAATKTSARRPSSAVGAKTVSAQNKADFRNAREKLQLAESMCPGEAGRATLEGANQSLGNFCLLEARKALQRNAAGTAYVYLTSAQNYLPGSSEISSLLSDTREKFENKTRVSIGVVLSNKANYRDAESILSEISAEIEAVATQVGLAQPNILDRTQSVGALRAIQSNSGLNSPVAIFSGDLITAGLSLRETARRVPSSYSYTNPRWKELDIEHDATEKALKNCEKQSGRGTCPGLAGDYSRIRSARDSTTKTLTENYSYYEKTIRVAGSAGLSFRYADSISRSVRTAETLNTSVADECVERTGVNEKDGSARNSDCSRIDESIYLSRMSNELKRDAKIRASTLLSELPLSYYRRAKTAANRPQAIEDYLQFLFLSANKFSAEAEDAKKSVLGFDAELTTDGVLR